MKRKIVETMVTIFTSCAIMAAPMAAETASATAGGMYPDCFMIKSIETAPGNLYELKLIDQNGILFRYVTDDCDWMCGDLVAVIMDDVGTDIVTDDIITAAKYAGWIDDMDNWIK